MFRKIVANLPFSPSLVGQLSFYARRLRKEETTRRAGLIVTALALVVQSLAVFSPPEAVNAASSADFVPGGVNGKQDLMRHYDRNTGKLKSVLTSLGITRADLNGTSKKTIGEKGNFNWSRTSLYSHAQGQRSWDYGGGTVFYRPMTLTAGAKTKHAVFAGHSKVFGWFAIKIDCGNIITSKPPRAPKPKVVCEDLTIKRLSPTRFRLDAKAAKKDGAKINGYQFIINKGGKTVKKKSVPTNKNSASFTYENVQPGTYRASVTVRSSLGPQNSADCRGSFDVNTAAACEDLMVEKLGNNRFTVTGKASAKKGATIKQYTYTVYNEEGKRIGKPHKFASNKKKHTFTITQETPGKYKVKLVIDTNIGERKGANCRANFKVPKPPKEAPPAAACTSASATLSNRSIVSLAGSATTSNGATVSKYTFVVKNAAGDEVHTVAIDSDKLSVEADSFELTTPGTYTVQLTVDTSVGPKTNTDNCVDEFTVAKPEVCPYNPSLKPNDPGCQPCPDNPNIWIKDDDCAAVIVNTKTATNMTQGDINATTKKARAGDKISYTITSENTGLVEEKLTMKEELRDVLEYATLIDNGGGTFDKDKKTLSWSDVTVKPNEKQSRTFVVQLMNKIPLTNTGVSDQDSYDCKMVNTYGNSTEIKVDCGVEKAVVEQVATELPTTGPGENMIFAGGLLAVVAYFYARSRQLGKEVRLVRKEVHAGAI